MFPTLWVIGKTKFGRVEDSVKCIRKLVKKDDLGDNLQCHIQSPH